MVTGSGQAETKDFDLSGFTGIQASHAFTILVNQADSFKVQVTADDNLWNSLDIGISENTLHLRTKPGVNITSSLLKAIITLPAISILDISGASNVTVSDFRSDNRLTFNLSGGSNVKSDNLKSGITTFDLSGASTATGSIDTSTVKFIARGGSRVDLSGSGTDATIDASGFSRITLEQFQLRNTTVILSEGSEARVNTQNIPSADLSGVSNLYYTGSPTIGYVQTSGGSAIHQQ
jgi:hypothetical protein